MHKHDDQGGSAGKNTTLARELREGEARGWLIRGYRDRASVERLKELLRSKKRSEANIEALLEEMRRQWAMRSQWWDKGSSG